MSAKAGGTLFVIVVAVWTLEPQPEQFGDQHHRDAG